MTTFLVGVIRVVTLSDQSQAEIHGRLIERYAPGITTLTRCIPDQPDGVHDDESEQRAVPKIIALAHAMAEQDKVDAVVISCAGDPGLAELKKSLPVPVVGAGEATALFARAHGEVFGVLGIRAEAPPAYRRLLPSLVGNGLPAGINDTRDLQTPQGYQNTLAKARELKAAGAQAIAVACTGMATIDICPTLERECGIPVIDPVMSEAVMVWQACLRQSRAASAA